MGILGQKGVNRDIVVAKGAKLGQNRTGFCGNYKIICQICQI